MKRTYTILSILLITLFLYNCGGGNKESENSKYPICDTKEKFVVAKVKIITTDVFPSEESNGRQIISSDLVNLLLPSNCDCADEKPLIINSDIYRVDTASHQKIFNHNDVSKFAGNTAKLKFWQNKAEVIKSTIINDILLQPTKLDNLTKKIQSFLLKNSKEDSVFVLSNSTNQYLLNGKSFRSFDNINSVRKNIEKIYLKNPKINFTVILNPPTVETAVINCTTWTKTGNQKCINNISHIEERCDTGEVRWINGGELKCKEPKLGFVSSKKITIKKSDDNLPKALPIQGIKADAIKEGNTKDLILKSKTNQ